MECGYHALTVDLAAKFIVEVGNGHVTSLPRLLSVRASEASSKSDLRLTARGMAIQSDRLLAIVEAYRKQLSRRDPAALALLERICIFRLTVNGDSLASLFIRKHFFDWETRRVAGNHLSALGAAALKSKIAMLLRMGLLEEPTSGQYRVHQALRDAILVHLGANKRHIHIAIQKWMIKHIEPIVRVTNAPPGSPVVYRPYGIEILCTKSYSGLCRSR